VEKKEWEEDGMAQREEMGGVGYGGGSWMWGGEPRQRRLNTVSMKGEAVCRETARDVVY
jgi:hypothetical protein